MFYLLLRHQVLRKRKLDKCNVFLPPNCTLSNLCWWNLVYMQELMNSTRCVTICIRIYNFYFNYRELRLGFILERMCRGGYTQNRLNNFEIFARGKPFRGKRDKFISFVVSVHAHVRTRASWKYVYTCLSVRTFALRRVFFPWFFTKRCFSKSFATYTMHIAQA